MKSSKYFVIIALAFCCTLNAHGQGKDYKYEHDWFGVTGVGMNFGLDRIGGHYNPENRDLSHLGAGTALDLNVGKRINDHIGVMIGYHGLDISERYSRYGTTHYHYGHADAVLMSFKYLMPYVHAGYLKAGANLRTTPGRFAGGAGVMAPIHVSKRFSVVPNLKLTLFEGSALKSDRKVAANISFTVGVGINLATPRAKKEVEYILSDPDTVIMHQLDTVVVKEIQVDTVYVGISERFTDRIAGITLFDFDRYYIRDEAFPVLDEIAQWLSDNPERTMLIEGYTDQRGTNEYNRVLSNNRAEAVRRYLIRCGVAPGRITAVGRGKGHFKEGTTEEEIHQQNRRVVITIR